VILGLVAVFVPPILNFVFIVINFRPGFLIALPPLIAIECGLVAVKKGRAAKSQIVNDQRSQGTGLAIAAQIIGGIGIALPIVGFVMVMVANA
jgi:hypothetical protein